VSRTDHVFKTFDPLCEALTKIGVTNAIVDGEIVCLDGEGVSLFNQLTFRRGVPYFYAFDLMWLDGQDLRSLPLIQRKELLRHLILGADNPALLYADHLEQFGVEFYEKWFV
jgi:bifunctional non-homologous end joining protein LigD